MEYHEDWNNPEMDYVRNERMQDIRDSRRDDWFATLSYVLAMVGLITIIPDTLRNPRVVTIIVVVVALGCYMAISMIGSHMDSRKGYRQDIVDSLPEQSGEYKPYCRYLEGLAKTTHLGDWVSWGQILAIAMVFGLFLITR